MEFKVTVWGELDFKVEYSEARLSIRNCWVDSKSAKIVETEEAGSFAGRTGRVNMGKLMSCKYSLKD